jgi:hypothetical protein
MVDPYTGETVKSTANHIYFLEGGTINAEYFKHGIENVYLSSDIDPEWWAGRMDLIEQVTGIRINENIVTTPRVFTNDIINNYTLANDNYKDQLGWFMDRDTNEGPVTQPKVATNIELPQKMHIGGRINYNGDTLTFFKERVGRWLSMKDVPNSVYNPSFMNSLAPIEMVIPSQLDRIYIVEFFDHRNALLKGEATFPLEYLRQRK